MNADLDKYYTDRLYNASIILGQAAYLAKALMYECQSIEAQEKMYDSQPNRGATSTTTKDGAFIQSIPFIDETMKSAFDFSSLLMQFSFIEALVNAVSDCTLEHDKTKQMLVDGEVTFLTERLQTYRRGKVVEELKFFSLEEKIKYYPKLFSKLHGDDFTVNIDKYAEVFQQAKSARDNITHPRVDFKGRIYPNDLFATAKAVYWYQGVVAELFDKYITNKHVLYQTEIMAFGLLKMINVVCNKGEAKHISEQQRKFTDEMKKYKKPLHNQPGAPKKDEVINL